jgi:predicted PhzF superfamily epimerase YddE/YHI9
MTRIIHRYFAPWVGIPEDPVTGSAHTVLGVYWARKLSKSHLHAFQASRRGGVLDLSLIPSKEDGEGTHYERIHISGFAKQVVIGKLTP